MNQYHYYSGCLGPNDLSDVLDAIYIVRNKWYYIGLKLKIPFHTLNAIEIEHHHKTTDCLTDMLQKWLTSVSPPPTWKDLVLALRSAPVGEYLLAEKIKKQYCHENKEQASGPQQGEV